MTAGTTLYASLVRRFWANVNQTDGCWEWRGPRQHNGYGAIIHQHDGIRETWRAHRLSWAIHNGPIPEGLWVLHRCDNPPCVNPAHLFLGDRADNMRDAFAKGRATLPDPTKTHCKRGHPYSSINSDGSHRCRECARLIKLRYHAKRRERERTPAHDGH